MGQYSKYRQIRSYCDDVSQTDTTLDLVKGAYSAQLLSQLGNHQEAVELLSKLIEEHPNMVDLYYDRSREYGLLKDWDNAIGDANKAIEINPTYGQGYYLLGKYAERSNISKALEYYTTAINYTPKAKHYVARGSLYDTLGNYDRAMSDFNKAIDVNPNYGIGYVKRSSLQRKQQKFEEALDDIIKAESLDEEYNFATQAEIKDNKLSALLALKRTEDALEVPKSLKDPGLVAMLNAEIYLQLGDPEKALQHSNTAVEIHPEKAWVYIIRGRCYQALHKNLEAIDDFSKAIELQPDDKPGYYLRGDLLLKQHQYSKAIEDLTKATHAQPNNSDAFQALSVAYYFTKQFSKSLEAVNIALQIDPAKKASLTHRGMLNYKLFPDLAVKDLTVVITRWPTDPFGYYFRGPALMSLGKYSEAANDLLKAVELGDNYGFTKQPDIYLMLGSCYMKMKDYPTSLEYYNKCIELEPKNVAALRDRALLHTAMSDLLAALKDMDSAIKFSKEPDPELYATRATLYRLARDPRAAEEYARAMELIQLKKQKGQLNSEPNSIELT